MMPRLDAKHPAANFAAGSFGFQYPGVTPTCSKADYLLAAPGVKNSLAWRTARIEPVTSAQLLEWSWSMAESEVKAGGKAHPSVNLAKTGMRGAGHCRTAGKHDFDNLLHGPVNSCYFNMCSNHTAVLLTILKKLAVKLYSGCSARTVPSSC